MLNSNIFTRWSDWQLACQARVCWLTTHQVQRLDSALPHICTCNVHTVMLSVYSQILKTEYWFLQNQAVGILQTIGLKRWWWARCICSCCCSCGESPCPAVDKHRLNGSRLEFQLTETVAEYLTIAIRSLIFQGRTNWTKKYIFEKTNGKSITFANFLKEVLYDDCFIRFKQSNPSVGF